MRPSIAIFDKTTGELVAAWETSQEHVNRLLDLHKDSHHCLCDHGVAGIENYTYDGKDKLKHKTDSTKDIDLSVKKNGE